MSWRKLILDSQTSLKKALKKLEASEDKIILVVNKNKSLLGTITDGDIRRYILKNNSNLNTEIKSLITRRPITALKKDSDLEIYNKLRIYKINHIPVVDNKKKILDLKSLKNYLKTETIDNPVVIMAGGFGKRMLPLTKKTPKPLLKINKRPMLEIILNKLISHGFKNFYISTHFKSEKFKKYFGSGKKWNININYLNEKTPLGTAGSLSLLPFNEINIPILVMNADILTDIDFKNLLKTHLKSRSSVTMCVREQLKESEFGVVTFSRGHLQKIVEKPIEKKIINAGIYVMNIKELLHVKKNTYLDMPTLLNNLVKKNKKVKLHYIYEDWNDVGNISQLNKMSQKK